MPLTQLFEHRWTTFDWDVAQLSVRLDAIAARCGLMVQHWDEDGLGPTSGCGGRLSSGIVIQLIEYAHLIEHLKAPGAVLCADAGDVERVGIAALLAEALPALGLEDADVVRRGEPPSADEVARYRERAREHRCNSGSSAP